MKKLLIVVCFILLIGLAYSCKNYKERQECLAKGHDWYFSRTDWKQSDEDPAIDMHLYIWECDECRVKMSKLHVELTFEQVQALQILNPSGKTRIFRMRNRW